MLTSRKRREQKARHLCNYMKVDCHCHILPGLDDGAQTLEDSIFLAGKLAEWGYQRAICTSHSSFMFRNTPATVTEAADKLRAELERRGIELDLVPSMEYRLIPETWPVVKKKQLASSLGGEPYPNRITDIRPYKNRGARSLV